VASHAAQIYRGMKDKIFSRLPAGLSVKTVMLADPYRVGPELTEALTAHRVNLNVLVVSPLTGRNADADAGGSTEVILYPWQLTFVHLRGNGEDIIDRLADPFHSFLNLYKFSDLDKLQLFIEDAGPHPVGRVRSFSVGAVDFDPPENAIMFEISGGTLAAFVVPFEVTARVSKDWRTRQS
jgi:hypothetical protein